MLYKPHYCCQCGEKIDRAAWHIWTSRKFCEICETEFPMQRRAPLILGAAPLVGLIFALGAYLKTSERQPVAEASRNTAVVVHKNAGNQKTVQNPPPSAVQNNGANGSVIPVAGQKPLEPENSSDPARAKNLRLVKGENSQTAASDAVYYCGAQTKKGTPCTRRVKGANKRCWQHEGQPALLPAEKLSAGQ